MPIFLERFLLPVVVAIVALLMTNVTKLDWTQRITGVLAIFFVAYFISHTVYIQRTAQAEQPSVDQVLSTVEETDSESLQANNAGDDPAEDPQQARTIDREDSENQERTTVPDKPLDTNDETPQVDIGSNSVVSINQQGGITAGTVNIQTDLPEPKLTLEPIVENQPDGGLYKSEFMMTIESQVAINNLYLEVKAPSITRMEAAPQRSGLSMNGHSGVRDGFAFTNLQNAYGRYRITVYTRNPERFEIIYSPE